MRARSIVAKLAVVTVLGLAAWAPEAEAQYQNRGIGFHVGLTDFNDAEGLKWAVPLGLQASVYFDHRIEGTVHATGILATHGVLDRQVFGFALQSGVRYLFMTDVLRPYAGLHLNYLHVFTEVVTYQYLGVGGHLGVDYFFSDAWSVGLRGQYTVYVRLNQAPTFGPSGFLELTTWY